MKYTYKDSKTVVESDRTLNPAIFKPVEEKTVKTTAKKRTATKK